MKRALVLAVLAAGCGGGEEGSTTTPVDGTWGVTVGACVAARSFNGANLRYSFAIGCPDSNNAVLDTQMEIGNFLVAGNTLEFSVDKTSCPVTAVANYQVPFAVSGNSLVLTFSTEQDVFTRLGTTGGNGVAQYGCLVNGAFTPGPLVTL